MGRITLFVYLGICLTTTAFAANGNGTSNGSNGLTAGTSTSSSSSAAIEQNLVHQFIVDKLKHPNPDTANLTLRLHKKFSALEGGYELPENQKKIFDSVFSRQSAQTLARLFRAYIRTEYNNGLVLGAPGVGKTHLTDQLIAMLSFGLMPDYIKEALRYTDDTSKPYGKVLASFIKNTDVFLVNITTLSLATESRGQPWAGSETRMKTTLTELFAAAKQEFNRMEGTKRVGRRTLFIFDEIATLPPLVNEALKTLQDETGYHDPEAKELLKVDSGYQVQAFTTPDEFRRMVKGDGAIERRYQIVRQPEPDEAEAFQIVREKSDREWSPLYGLLAEDEAIEFLIHFRRFLTSPPLAMPASVLGAMNDLYTWKISHPGSDPDLISLYDAQMFLMRRAGLTDVWFPGPNGEPPFHDFVQRVLKLVVGQDEVVVQICERIKTWARYELGTEVPVFFLGGPKGTGKDTLVAALNMVLFGNTGSNLNFSISGEKGFGINALIEGPPLGNHSDTEIGLLAQAIDNHGHGIIALNEAYDTPSAEFDKLKVFVEAGEIRPKGTDSRRRPLMFPIFIMGQFGEDLFEGKSEAEQQRIYAALTQDQIEDVFLLGKKNGEYGAVSPALLDRAKKTGGIFMLSPASTNNYPSIIQTWLPGIKNTLEKKGVKMRVSKALTDYTARKAQELKLGTRGLRALTIDMTLSALSRANDMGMPIDQIEVGVTYGTDEAGEDEIRVKLLNAKKGTRQWYRIPAASLLRCSRLLKSQSE